MNREKSSSLISNTRQGKLKKLEASLGVCFNNLDLLNHSLRHPSFTGENGLAHSKSNQRLEFLGDSVLYIVTTACLFQKYPDEDEGKLTQRRINLISEAPLSLMAEHYRLYDYILLSKGGIKTGIGRLKSTMADTFEAVLAAIYLDQGLEKAKEFLLNSFSLVGITI